MFNVFPRFGKGSWN